LQDLRRLSHASLEAVSGMVSAETFIGFRVIGKNGVEQHTDQFSRKCHTTHNLPELQRPRRTGATLRRSVLTSDDIWASDISQNGQPRLSGGRRSDNCTENKQNWLKPLALSKQK
jgi:hypothetical protein